MKTLIAYLMEIFIFFMLNNNQKDLKKLFDYEFYKNNSQEYVKLREKINIGSKSDVDYAIKLINGFYNEKHYRVFFNPVEDVLKLFNRNQKIDPKILSYYFDNILPTLKLIFHHVPGSTKGIILETLYCIGSRDAINLFIEYVLDTNNDLDNYNSYEAIKAFGNTDNEEIIKIFVENADKLLKPNRFRTVAFVELFGNWALSGKLAYNPLQNNLDVIEEWLKDTNYKTLSYAVSGCAALSTIKSEKANKLLKIASKHPKLEIQLEAAFAQILLGDEIAKKKLKLLAQDPIIAWRAFTYIRELHELYEIDCSFNTEDIITTVKSEEDFIAIASMAEWCTHHQEYGITPDKIWVWAKEEIYWPPSQKKLQVYLIKYKYHKYDWQGKIQDIEHVGYYLPDEEKVFSSMKSFDDVYEAYAEYASVDIVN